MALRCSEELRPEVPAEEGPAAPFPPLPGLSSSAAWNCTGLVPAAWGPPNGPCRDCRAKCPAAPACRHGQCVRIYRTCNDSKNILYESEFGICISRYNTLCDRRDSENQYSIVVVSSSLLYTRTRGCVLHYCILSVVVYITKIVSNP